MAKQTTQAHAQPPHETNTGLFGESVGETPSSLDVVAQQTEAEKKGETDWLDLPAPPDHPKYAEFPYSGSPLLVTPDGEKEVLVQWKVTRRIDKKAGMWKPTAFFMLRNGGGQQIDFEPLGYKRAPE